MNVNITLKTSLNRDFKKSLQQIPTLNNNIVQVQKWNTIQLVYNLYTYVPSMIMIQRTCKIQTSFLSSFLYKKDGLCMNMKLKLGALSLELKV
jgi:hypothetical protein